LRRLGPRSSALALAALIVACSSGSGAGDGYASCPTDVPTACPSPPPSWTTDVQPIVSARCALGGQCHGAGGAEEASYDFTSYAGVKKNFLTMETEVASCQMPPSDAVAPTDAEWLTLLQWFQCDAPDN
jgi:hypothetical protein